MDYTLNLSLLQEVRRCYSSLADFRQKRQRCKRYAYGDQWGDPVDRMASGPTEEQQMLREGVTPLKNNLIRRLVRNVIGLYSSQATEPVCVARDAGEQAQASAISRLLRYNGDLNRLSALMARSLEEFLISGMVVHRKYYGRCQGQEDCWTDFVPSDAFFVDADMRDFRGWDCSLIGEVHECSLQSLCAAFARDDSDDAALRAIYGDAGRCRVIEAWRREVISHYRCHDPLLGYVADVEAADYDKVKRINSRRKAMGQASIEAQRVSDERWRYYFLSPTGHVLAQGDTPYRHGSHPYVMKAYPLIDGEIHSFVADILDQQRYANRLISLFDWIVRSTARGVLMVPEDSIPRGVSPSDFAESWSRFDGVVLYRPSPTGQVPQQVSAKSSTVGISDLLKLQLGFFEDISGVNSALQGKLANASMSAELYGQQTVNAATTLRDILDTFGEFARDGAYKDAKNIQQYYSADKVRRILGADSDIRPIGDVEFDLSIRPNLSSPATRRESNATLLEIWRSGQIDLRQMLEAGDFDFADRLRATMPTPTDTPQTT